jgi:hypothetical protein
MITSRETIMAALLARLQTTAGVVTVSRRVKLWTDVPPAEQPAIFIAEHGEDVAHRSENTPGLVTIGVDLFVYVYTGEPGGVPATTLNTVLDAIDAALAPSGADMVRGRQTLGGLVSHCFVNGSVFKDPGDLDNQGLAVVPIKILVPC